MDHERFDELAKTLSSGASRRKMIGGAIAGLVGAGVARVSGVDAKGKKKSRKKKAGKEELCRYGDCPDGSCCVSTPPGSDQGCVNVANQLGSQLCGENDFGDPAGSGICATCPPGTRCGIFSIGPFQLTRCICDAVSCADGCCYQDPNSFQWQCIVNGSGDPINSSFGPDDGSFVCGVGGGDCNFCSGPQAAVFSGCCDANGRCRSGTSNSNCGTDGLLCDVCLNDSTCGVDQACTGATTTTTTTTPGPCADGRPRCTTGGLSVCCDPGFVCTGSGCARKKKKKKKKHHKKH